MQQIICYRVTFVPPSVGVQAPEIDGYFSFEPPCLRLRVSQNARAERRAGFAPSAGYATRWRRKSRVWVWAGR